MNTPDGRKKEDKIVSETENENENEDENIDEAKNEKTPAE